MQSIIEQVTTALGWAVLHSLWQCTLVGVLAAAAVLPVRRASVRYAVWTSAVCVCFGWFVVTLVGGLIPDAGVGAAGMTGISGSLAGQSPSGGLVSQVVAWLWAGGFVFCTLRFSHQWLAARRLRTGGIVALDEAWLAVFEDVRSRIGVSPRVRLLVSEIATSPMVVGWVRPVVIVPVSVLTALSPEQVRLVLVHELAHLRRYDHLVNALQVLIETAMFYHPVVWWMSHQARLEREHCCDDAAVRWGGDAVVFARALAEMETVRTNSRAVLALNQGGSLMERIARILGTTSDKKMSRGVLRTAAALAAGTLVAAAGIANAALGGEEPTEVRLELIRTNVESGVMTTGQARELYDRLIFPGSDAQLMMDEYFAQVRLDIDAAIELGGITPEAGRAKLEEIASGMDESVTYHFMMDVLGMSKREATRSITGEKLAAMVAAGEVTQEEADRRLAALDNPVVGVVVQLRPTLEQIGAKIRHAVESGEITPEVGRARMDAAKREIEKHEWLVSVTEEIDGAVERGEITLAEGRAKHDAALRQLDRRNKEDQIRTKIEGAVKRGEMTREEADAKYAAMDEEVAKVFEAERAHRQRVIASFAANGPITSADGKWKLYPAIPANPQNGDGIAEQIEAAVVQGEITREEADAKYEALSRGHVKYVESVPILHTHLQGRVMEPGATREVEGQGTIELIEVDGTILSADGRWEFTPATILPNSDGIGEQVEAAPEGEAMPEARLRTIEELEAEYDLLEREVVVHVASVPIVGPQALTVFRSVYAPQADWDGMAQRIEASVERGEMTRDAAKLAYERMGRAQREQMEQSFEVLHTDHLGIRPMQGINDGC